MLKNVFLAGLAALALSSCEKPAEPAAKYTEEGKLLKPDPEGWIFVSSSASAIAPAGSGGDAMMSGQGDMMSGDEGKPEETPKPVEGRMDIIRIDPAAWAFYKKTGQFPDGTVFAMSFYSMHDKDMGADRFWADQPQGMEVAVKDSQRFGDGWAYFRFKGDTTEAEAFPTEKCFQCHHEKGATDNVFTQLYEAFQR